MLKYDEILDRLNRNPEPKEVAEMRKVILDSFNELEFVEEGHKYFLPKKDGTKEELISVSKFTHQFEPYKDWDTIAERYAVNHNMEVSEVQRTWHENNLKATNCGTGIHLMAENYFYFATGQIDKICDVIKPQYEDGYLIPHSPKEEAVTKFWEDVLKIDSMYPLLAEIKVYTGMNDMYDFKQNYAGTFDLSFAIKHKGEWGILLMDWKTNSSLKNNYNRNMGNTYLPPFDDYIDESLSAYTLQLNAYQLALSQTGYKVFDRKILWLKEDGTYEKISVPDITDRLKQFLIK